MRPGLSKRHRGPAARCRMLHPSGLFSSHAKANITLQIVARATTAFTAPCDRQRWCDYCQFASFQLPPAQFRLAGPVTQVAFMLSIGVLVMVPLALVSVQIWPDGCVVMVTA